MSDPKFKVGDKIVLVKGYMAADAGKTGEIKAFAGKSSVGDLYVCRLDDFAGKGHNGNLSIGGYVCPINESATYNIPEHCLELQEPEYTVIFPVDVFDSRVFFTKEWQDANYKSTTGTSR